MALIEIRLSISDEEVTRLDEAFSESEIGDWSIHQDVDSGTAYFLGYFECEEEADIAWAQVKSEFFSEYPEPIPIERNSLKDEDWRESYKEHFKAWHFKGLHWVPIWEKESYIVPKGDGVVWLDPGMAFGTGNHETTRLCVERLIEYASDRVIEKADLKALEVIDAGCGSGILILSAAKLGFEKLRAFDNDAEAVRIAEENATMNGIEDLVHFEVADLTSGFKEQKADFLMANILANILAEYARNLIDALNPGGRLVLSGILTEEIDEVRTVFLTDPRIEKLGSISMGEWSDLVFNRIH